METETKPKIKYIVISPEKQTKIRHRKALGRLTEYLNSLGITKSKYRFATFDFENNKKRTICIFYLNSLRYTFSDLNTVEDKFYGPIGEKHALRRMFRFVKEQDTYYSGDAIGKLRDVDLNIVQLVLNSKEQGSMEEFPLRDI